MKYQIGYRTIKTALGTTLAIMLAHQLGLKSFVSAGIITILCIQVTKRKTLRTSWDRFMACTLAMPVSYLFFEGIAYHPIMIGLMLLLFIPLLVMLKLKDGVVTSTVIILHIYTAGKITWPMIIQEFGIIITGIGVALIMNLYMPSVDKKLEEYQVKIEDYLRIIFKEMVEYLKTGNSEWDGKELVEVDKVIEEAKVISFREIENRFWRNENLYFHYFKMREKQLEIIERILPLITSIPLTTNHSHMTADFFEELSERIHPGNTASIFLGKLNNLKIEFEEMPLPTTREEFEARAALFQIIREIEQYLIIKSSFKGIHKNQKMVTEAN
ncbi:aromatic acid exporter family protein [Pseudoneobacillus sp. C159]